MFVTLFLLIAFVVVILARSPSRATSTKSGSRLPGPRGLPFIGNVQELPSKCVWMKFHEWAEKYGPIYQVNLAGTNHVWISRDHVAHDLLSKRIAIYSGRPLIPALEQDNRTSDKYVPLMSANATWSRQRKFGKQILDKSQKAAFYGYPELESVRLLHELMTEPEKYDEHLESFVARTTCRLAWGTPTPSDELKQRARELLVAVSPNGAFGNKLPWIMSLPARWIKAKAWELRRSRIETKFFKSLQDEVERSMKAEVASPSSWLRPSNPSWTRTFLENQSNLGFLDRMEGAHAVGMHGIAGALTIAAPMQSFCLAMTHHPQYQHILHEEIDRVLGDRMPTLADMPGMPVLRAFIRETLRWRPPVPTGIPHALEEDDVYKGYHIPKGSVVHPLEWSISRDPEVFPEPDQWNPMRWLDEEYPTYQEPMTKYPTIAQYSQFGYGKRICLGMGVTEADLFVGLGSVAWLFSMSASEAATEDSQAGLNQGSRLDVDSPGASRRDSCASVSTTLSEILEPDQEHDIPPTEEIMSCKTIRRRSSDDSGIGSDVEAPAWTQHFNDSALSMSYEGELKGPATYTVVSKASSTSRHSSIAESVDVAYAKESLSEVALDEELDIDHIKNILSEGQTLQDDLSPSFPGCFGSLPPASIFRERQRPAYESDPTMHFSTLLIAKPMPFKFDLNVRSQARAETVDRRWATLKSKGEFPESRSFWEGGVHGDEDYGWGAVVT